MIEHGFQPDFPAGTPPNWPRFRRIPSRPPRPGAQDLRKLLWSSIDNDTSKDLDQIEWAEQLPDGRIRVLVGVADVDARVQQRHGHRQPREERDDLGLYRRQGLSDAAAELSEGITSLNENEDRVAMVIEYCRGRRRARRRMARPTARWFATARNWPTTRGRMA
jgi:exoribonuclease-2